MQPQTQPYRFISIDHFDARSGLKRCIPPGVGASTGDSPIAIADFWRDANGRILLRATLRKACYSFAVLLHNGTPIPDEEVEDFGWYVSDQLIKWVFGHDDEPFEELVFEED